MLDGGDGGGLMEREHGGTNLQPITVTKHGGLAHPATVEQRAIAAAQVHEPMLVLLLRVNKRMSARHPVIHEDNLIRGGAADGTGDDDGKFPPLRILQPDGVL